MGIRIQNHPGDPLVTDRSQDLASGILWLIYSLWGLVATFAGITTITEQAGPLYNFLWSMGIGVVALTASLSAFSLFFDLGTNLSPPMKKRVELWAVRVLALLIAVYPILLSFAVLGGDTVRGPSAVLAFSYLVIPIWRSHVLVKRIRALDRARKEIINNGRA